MERVGLRLGATLRRPEFFGRRHIGSSIGNTQLFMTCANAGGPLIVGLVYDISGTYEASLWMLLATWLTCAALAFVVRPPPRAPQSAAGVP